MGLNSEGDVFDKGGRLSFSGDLDLGSASATMNSNFFLEIPPLSLLLWVPPLINFLYGP